MAQVVPWTGASGFSYNFQTYRIGAELPPAPAVYVLCMHFWLTKWTALYVGQTVSLKDRLTGSHDGFKRALGRGATHVGIMYVRDEHQRLEIEKDLISGLKPSENYQNFFGEAAIKPQKSPVRW